MTTRDPLAPAFGALTAAGIAFRVVEADAVAAGRRVILEIDLQGARQVRAKLPGVRSVFIAPPRWETLRERLLHRGTEDEAEMDRRLQTAQAELAAADEFDHIVVNDDFSTAVDQLVELLGL